MREFLADGNASEFTAQLPEHVDLNFAGDGRTVERLPLTLVRLYSYDAVGRRTGEVASDGSSVTMGYSLAGSIASMPQRIVVRVLGCRWLPEWPVRLPVFPLLLRGGLRW